MFRFFLVSLFPGIDSNPDNSNSRRLSDKLTTLLKGNKPQLQDYNRSNFRQYWMPDSTGKECYQVNIFGSWKDTP